MTQGRGLPQSAELWVEITPAEQRVEPGQQAVFAVSVENRSRAAQGQRLDVDGLPRDWVRIDFDSRSKAFPQERRAATVTVSVPADAEGGHRPFHIVVQAEAERSTAEAILDVLIVEAPPLAPGVTLNPAVLEMDRGSGVEERVQLDVRNVGSQETEYLLTVSGLAAGWFRIRERLTVAGGGSEGGELWIRPPASAEAGSHAFTVRLAAANAPDAVTEAAGELRIRAPGPQASTESSPPVPQQRTPSTVSPLPSPAPLPPAPVDSAETPAVVAPDVLLAPSTTFRFGPDRVSDQGILTIQNQGRLHESYRIDLDGLPPGWYTLTASEISLEPGASQQVPLRLNPHPGAEDPAGEYQFRVRVFPQGYPDATTEIAGVLVVEGYESFEVLVEPPQGAGRTVGYSLTLSNTGSRPVRLLVDATDLESRVRFRLPPATELGAGQQVTLPLRVGARRNRFIGSPETFDFRVHALSEGADPGEAASFDARFIHQPFMSQRPPVLAALFALVIGIVLLGVFWAPPHVEGFVEWSGCKIHQGPECESVETAIVSEPVATATTAPATATPSSTASPAPTLPAAAECLNDSTRTSAVPGLAVGAEAFADDRSNIRGRPVVADNRIGQVQLDSLPDTQHLDARRMIIIDGPVCNPDFTWWGVRSEFYSIDEGWVVEVDSEGNVNLSPEP